MIRRTAALITAGLFIAATAHAGDGQHHDHGPVDLGNLGKVRFAVSCKGAQKEFSRAVAIMHSFWYAEAEKAFQEIAQREPDCAMAHWGIAMANYHPLWAPPTADELARGRAAAEKALAMKGGTPRERAYIEAIHLFYAGADTADHPTRALRYEEAMGRVASAHPKDREASIFYALALLGTASPNDKTYAKQKQAAGILAKILPQEREHPGVAHYIIHSYDYPGLAEGALEAARTYAKIAPGSPHALHMPSHIFTRLGLWDESIASNADSAEKARMYIRQVKPGAISFDELHAIDYLVYAHLQQADDLRAQELVDALAKQDAPVLDSSNFAAAYAYAAVPVRFALERRDWKSASVLKLHPAAFPWSNFLYAEAIVHFGRAVGAARSGDLNVAKAATDRLRELQEALADQKNNYWAEQVEIQRLGAQAWLAWAAGLKEEGLRLMRAAADLESRTEKHPVTPGAVVPARELLAEMLLEVGKPADALVEAEEVLKVSPRRYNALWTAARAAELAGNRPVAKARYNELLEVVKKDAGRPELESMRTFVAVP